MDFIGDIVERDTSQSKPTVTFDDIEPSTTGFPVHRKKPRVSAFKRQQQGKAGFEAAAAAGSSARAAHESKLDAAAGPDTTKDDFEAAERKRIDKENQATIDNMSPEEIEKERAELMSGLNPSLIQRLLLRANIDEKPGGKDPFAEDEAKRGPAPEIQIEDTSAPPPPEPPKPVAATPKAAPKPPVDESRAPAEPPKDLFPISDQPDSTHFPAAPALPDLDPSHPDFLATLHEKFFPNLPADPSKLAWMAPLPTPDSAADRDSPYYPGQESLPISALRFDFRGALIPPRLSRQIPVTKGLHHHGQAPEAAGYTIEELAILARSAVPAQRCVAFQTLGRILYRLGQGDWGRGENDGVARGIWSSVVEGRVLESLSEAATKDSGHRGSRAYATEALWLLEKGGWKEQLQVR
ncbi:RPAP1-like protein [Plectosphaerella cucumerina]|uniref:RPAP1-like protein n=1 Tax=Plectosphaerella cucumerina TaxID=40658 RepID=A0A8K0TEH9_9PEZI|nr:RPAP1-like protein [Plectosphaerella cucumerina]